MNLKQFTEDPRVFTDAVIVPSISLIDPEVKDQVQFPSGMENMITMLEGNDLKIVSGCSDNYYLAKNQDIHTMIAAMLKDAGITFTFGSRMTGLAEFEMTYILNTATEETKKLKIGDLYPTIRLINSYNRRIKLGITSGIFRVWCENGCANLHSAGTELNSLHTAGLRSYIKESIENITGGLITSYQEMLGEYSNMVDIKVPNVSGVIEEAMQSLGIRNNRKEILEERVEIETIEFNRLGMDPNMFLVYNVLNYGLNHSGTFDIKQFATTDAKYINYCMDPKNSIIHV